MTTTIQKWGNSQGIRIPKYLLDAVQWTENEQISVSVENNKIIIKKIESQKTIKELFDDFQGDYEPVEIDWGNPMGNEIW